MPQKYYFLVDESGDQGLDVVSTKSNPFGASSYLTMGGVLVPVSKEPEVLSTLESVKDKLDVEHLHCTDLSHPQVSYFFSSEISQMKVLAFGLIFKKSTLGDYKEQITGAKQAQDYYNKCTHYLLELLASFISEKSIPGSDVKIVFEHKRGHDYERLSRYLRSIAEKPIDRRAAKLAHLSPFQLEAKTKEEEPLLALADCAAYALHKAFCSENNRLGITEQRYLREIKDKFWADPERGKIANFGLKFVKGPISMGLSGNDLKFAMKFYAEK